LPEEDLKPGAGSEYWVEDHDSESMEDFEETSTRSPVLLRIVAFITALALLGLVIVNSWPGFRPPLADLVKKSLQLKNDVDISLMQAVVQISVVSRRQGSSVAVEQKTGTGFNIDPGGVIVTNHHVIEGALNMSITFPDGKVYKADHWVSKPETDLAVIALQAAGLPVLPVNYSRLPAPGDKIRVVGNPLALNNIVVEGKVEQYLRVRDKQGKIFSIAAPIYPGNSGSPVFDMDSQVVGVVFGSMNVVENGSEKVTGLALTMDEAIDLIKSVVAEQRHDTT